MAQALGTDCSSLISILSWAGAAGLHIDGGFIECSAYRGFGSAVTSAFPGFAKNNESFCPDDIFEGISEAHDPA